MTPERWRQIEDLYQSALKREEIQRAAFLMNACAGDDTLRHEVEQRLAQHERAGSFLEATALPQTARDLPVEYSASWIGRRIRTYEIVGLLGVGGMGQVYRARDTKLHRDVAIKVLPKAFAQDADRLLRFEREARALASFNHPHIGAIYGFEEDNGERALILELVEGQTLGERLVAGALPVEEALNIASQIADALEAAHEKGFLHRDLKPANIKIAPDSSAKVLDFGLAKVLAEVLPSEPTLAAARTGEGAILGTPAYMSPEQARGRAVDKRTDIWSFGCVLYEMLTGQKAFAGETVPDTIAKLLHREPELSALPEKVPSPIRRLLQRCLEKDVKFRLHDIADARIEIEDVLRGPAAGAAETGTIKGVRSRAAPRTVGALVATAVVLLALGAAAGARWWPVRVTSSGSSLARLTIRLPAAQAIEKGQFQPVALSPDGKLLVYTAAVDGGRTNLYLRPLDDLDARPIAATEGASTPFFSPDGRWLAFYANGQLKKVAVAGGVPLTICEAPPVWSATWGQNGSIVFATTLPLSGLWFVSANGGEPVQISTPESDEVQHGYPQLLPDGIHVLFSVRRENAWRLALLDLKTRNRRLLGNGRVIGEGAQYLPTGHLVYL